MNHIYHSIWNEALGAWVAVSEISKGQCKRSSNRRKNSMTASPLKDWQSSSPLLATGLLLCSSASWALPTGNELVAGQATVNTPNAGQMQINQASQNAVINWQGFSIAPHEAVNIQQPNPQAALLNRVVGQNASQIQGQLNANGQVYLVNPNGVIFSKTAQVDVGGLVATTHNISNADFMAGKNHFTQDGAKGTVENHGTINTANGGVVALIGESVTNTGTISTPKGTIALAAGKTVDLDFQGNGLVEVKVTEAALNAQIDNQGAIRADAGRVVLNAKAANALVDTVINQDGIIKAQGLIERSGEIILDGGDNGAVKVSGTLDTRNTNQGLNASTTGGNITVKGAAIQLVNGANVNASGNTGGGTITIGDKQTTQQTTIEQGATVSAQTLDSGKAGTINVLANMDNGLVKIDGQLDASAPNNGDGGFIDTSAAHVKVADSVKISTKANNGKTGTWLIDPTDYTIAASGGDITGANLASYLGASNVEIQTLATGSKGLGNIFVNDAVTWNNFNQLILTAHRNVNVNAAINALGGGSVRLRADSLGTGTGTVTFAGNGHVTVNNGAAVGIHYNPVSYTDAATKSDNTGNPYSSKVTLNSGSTLSAFMLVNDVNKLQAMNTNLGGNYALAKDIDASVTANWNGGKGFIPIGTFDSQLSGNLAFKGKLSGLNHTISGLFTNTSGLSGLFGRNDGQINNIGLTNRNLISGGAGLVGYNAGTVSNSYVMGNIIGDGVVGGLVGHNVGTISNSYAIVNVASNPNNNYFIINGQLGGLSNDYVGGLVGRNQGTVSSSYATGSVTGDVTGGLVGYNNAGTVSNSYATASVTGGVAGGLIGVNRGGTVSNSYATGKVEGITQTIPINPPLIQLPTTGGFIGSSYNSTISNSFWNIDNNVAGMLGIAAGNNFTGVTGKTTAQMKQQASFTGWDFVNTWQINQGVSYPTLKNLNPQTPTSLVILTPSGIITPPVVPTIPVVIPSLNQSTNPSVLIPDSNTVVTDAGSQVIIDTVAGSQVIIDTGYQQIIGGLIGTINNPSITTPPDVNPPKVEIIITPIQETTKIINTVLDFSTPTGQILYLSKEFSTFLSGVANVMIKDPTELADLYVNEWGGSRFDMELQLYRNRMSMIRVVDGAQNEMVNQEYGYALQSISDTINLALDANDTLNAVTGLKDAPKKIKTAFTAITKAVQNKPVQLVITSLAIAEFLNNVDNLSDIEAIYKTFDRILGKSLDADVIKALKSVKTMSELIPKNAKNVETIKKFLKDSLAFVALGTSTTSIEQIMKSDTDRKIFLQDKLIEKLSTRADWKSFADMPVYQKISVFNDGILWDSHTYKLVETTAKEAYPDLFK